MTFRSNRTEEELAVIRHFLYGLDPLFRIKSTIPLRSVQTFLIVAEKEGLNVTEYAKRAGIPVTTMSRHLLDMGDWDRHMDPGMGLLDGRDNPESRRERQYYLTPKGRALIAAITKGAKQ